MPFWNAFSYPIRGTIWFANGDRSLCGANRSGRIEKSDTKMGFVYDLGWVSAFDCLLNSIHGTIWLLPSGFWSRFVTQFESKI